MIDGIRAKKIIKSKGSSAVRPHDASFWGPEKIDKSVKTVKKSWEIAIKTSALPGSLLAAFCLSASFVQI